MSWLNKIFDVFSRRNKSLSENIYTIPNTTRNRIILWCNDIFVGNRPESLKQENILLTFWKEIHRFLQYRHGNLLLSGKYDDSIKDVLAFLEKCDSEEYLDFIEYIFRVNCFFHIDIPEKKLIDELNQILQIDNLPYFITDFVKKDDVGFFHGQEHKVIKTIEYPKVIMKENDVIHSEIIKPVLYILQQQEFINANSEFLDALEDYRKRDYEDCLTKCGSAFESVLKIICEKNGWVYNQTDTASTLISTFIYKTNLERYFESVLIITATLRNKLSSSHGAGTIQKDVPQHIARYTINATASAILFVVDVVEK
ncbi:abortive infection family protein [Candidatus Latescibacterota bacterium]